MAKKLVSEKQINANAQNAMLGGVKSDEGKLVVRFNARKHGILGNLIAEYEDDFYKNYLEQLFDELQPKSCVENILVERIALYYLKLYRVTKAESELLRNCINPTSVEYNPFVGNLEGGYDPVVKPSSVSMLLEIYSRYETALENRLYKAIYELRVYRKEPL